MNGNIWKYPKVAQGTSKLKFGALTRCFPLWSVLQQPGGVTVNVAHLFAIEEPNGFIGIVEVNVTLRHAIFTASATRATTDGASGASGEAGGGGEGRCLDMGGLVTSVGLVGSVGTVELVEVV